MLGLNTIYEANSRNSRNIELRICLASQIFVCVITLNSHDDSKTFPLHQPWMNPYSIIKMRSNARKRNSLISTQHCRIIIYNNVIIKIRQIFIQKIVKHDRLCPLRRRYGKISLKCFHSWAVSNVLVLFVRKRYVRTLENY